MEKEEHLTNKMIKENFNFVLKYMNISIKTHQLLSSIIIDGFSIFIAQFRHYELIENLKHLTA